MTTPTHDLALARAERDAWQSTCEELHRTIAGRDVEIEAHLGRCEAADQRARSLEAGLAHVNGNIMECRAELRAIRDLVAPGNPQGTVVDAVRAMATGLIESIGARDAAEQARDMARDSRDAAIARAEAAERTLSGLYDDSKAELAKLRAELAELTVTRDRLLAREHEDGRLHAQLRAELAELRAPKKHPSAPDRCPKCEWTNVGLVNFGAPGVPLWLCHGCAARTIAELRARPVLDLDGRTFEDALEAGFWRFDALRSGHGRGPHLEGSKVNDREAFKMAMRRAVHGLGPATLPSPDRAEELTAAIYGAVERAERAMTPGPWEAKIYTTHVAGTSQETQWHEAIAGGPSSGTVVCETEWSVFEDESAIGAANIRGIVALRNAAPALIAEVRALRAAAEEREAELMAKAAPAREVAPTLVAVSDEELATAYSVAHDQPIPRMAPLRDRTIAGARAVRAKLGAAEVTEERVKAALKLLDGITSSDDLTDDESLDDRVTFFMTSLRASAAKGG